MTKIANDEDDFEMLKKAVAFSQANLGDLRDGDILNLKEDLWDLTGRGHTLDDTKQGFLKRLTADQLAEIQDHFRKCFETISDEPKDELVVSWKIETEKTLIVFALAADTVSSPFSYHVYSPNPVNAAGIALVNLIVRSRATPEQFRRCPECSTLFFLARKPDQRNFYCSQRCAVRVAVRNNRKSVTRRAKKAAGRRSGGR